MPEFVDTHCHIQSVGLSAGEVHTRELWAKAKDLTTDNVIQAAVAAGVTRFVLVGCTLDDSRLAIDISQNYQETWASIGLHPHEAKLYDGNIDQLSQFTALAIKPKVVAVGECGLDYFYLHSPKKAQQSILRTQIELALEHQLPLIFHIREAFDDFWPIFDSYHGIRGVVHSFSDSLQNLDKVIERGLSIGVNGIATFAKSETQINVYRRIPRQHLLLETDAPFLTPVPYRGKINTPERVVTIAEFLSHLRGEELGQLAEATTANARTLFSI